MLTNASIPWSRFRKICLGIVQKSKGYGEAKMASCSAPRIDSRLYLPSSVPCPFNSCDGCRQRDIGLRSVSSISVQGEVHFSFYTEKGMNSFDLILVLP
ncbi:hypothetical protein AVEN_150675-1 [Araneus ventricosus]|uniref:Uncharacterized protein n=1 Tax=Araneus ventricosus TaxID=182803 RepID=A0A4Y2PAG3_ARAVE|nr:hypothetical protein AVEN_150675-1 [Araneus ventricosus]